jgi:hypothetical protein
MRSPVIGSEELAVVVVQALSANISLPISMRRISLVPAPIS